MATIERCVTGLHKGKISFPEQGIRITVILTWHTGHTWDQTSIISLFFPTTHNLLFISVTDDTYMAQENCNEVIVSYGTSWHYLKITLAYLDREFTNQLYLSGTGKLCYLLMQNQTTITCIFFLLIMSVFLEKSVFFLTVVLTWHWNTIFK